jgi:membrane protein involved in colicin uptake
MDTTNASTPTSQLALQAASSPAQPTLDAAAEKAAAEKAAAEKAAAEKAAAEKAAAEKAAAEKAAAEKAAKAAKPPRARRGPPADGGEEDRVNAILSTSKLVGKGGARLRRGQAVSVPARRVEALVRTGKIRLGTPEEIERAATRYGSDRIG